MKPQPPSHVNIIVGILKSFVALVFSPIKIPHGARVPIILLLEPRFGVTDAVWQSAFGLVRGGGAKVGLSTALRPRFYDGLARAVCNILIIFPNQSKKLHV